MLVGKYNFYGLVKIKKKIRCSSGNVITKTFVKRNKLTNLFLEDVSKLLSGDTTNREIWSVRVYGEASPYVANSPNKTDSYTIFGLHPYILKSRTYNTLSVSPNVIVGSTRASFTIENDDQLDGNDEYYLIEAGLFSKETNRLWARILLPTDGVENVGLYKDPNISFDFEWYIIANIS